MAMKHSYFTFDVQESSENHNWKDGASCGPDANSLAQGKQLQNQPKGTLGDQLSNHLEDPNFKRMRRNTYVEAENIFNLWKTPGKPNMKDRMLFAFHLFYLHLVVPFGWLFTTIMFLLILIFSEINL